MAQPEEPNCGFLCLNSLLDGREEARNTIRKIVANFETIATKELQLSYAGGATLVGTIMELIHGSDYEIPRYPCVLNAMFVTYPAQRTAVLHIHATMPSEDEVTRVRQHTITLRPLPRNGFVRSRLQRFRAWFEEKFRRPFGVGSMSVKVEDYTTAGSPADPERDLFQQAVADADAEMSRGAYEVEDEWPVSDDLVTTLLTATLIELLRLGALNKARLDTAVSQAKELLSDVQIDDMTSDKSATFVSRVLRVADKKSGAVQD